MEDEGSAISQIGVLTKKRCTFGVNAFISATGPPLFLGVDACRDAGEGQFRVGFRSVFGRF